MLCSERVEAVAIGAGGESQQAIARAKPVTVPGKQRWIFHQELLQPFDVVIVNDALSLLCRPLQRVGVAQVIASGSEVGDQLEQ